MALFGSKSILGVDLGTAGIKIAELSNSGDRFDLKNYGIIDFLAKEGSSPKLSDDILIAGLKDLIARTRPSTKDAVASISSFLTFTTVIEMPYLSAKDLEKAIPFEARKYIPIPLSDVVLDWSIINVGGQSNQTPNVEVFLAAVPKNEAERYKNIFTSAGLNIKALELENIAIIRALLGDDKSPLAIINLGGRSTSILVVDKGFERVSRNYELGGFEITKALAVSLGISFERAEEIKRKDGLKGNQAFNQAISPLIDMIVFEVRKTIANYEENKMVKIGKVILIGGQSQMPGIKDYFAQKLGKDILIGDPLKRISYNKVLEETLKNAGPSLSVALGLAMRKI
ncbi:MAG: type IV pilus assembly protein PilM [Patescibacteria group bacterium]